MELGQGEFPILDFREMAKSISDDLPLDTTHGSFYLVLRTGTLYKRSSRARYVVLRTSTKFRVLPVVRMLPGTPYAVPRTTVLRSHTVPATYDVPVSFSSTTVQGSTGSLPAT